MKPCACQERGCIAGIREHAAVRETRMHEAESCAPLLTPAAPFGKAVDIALDCSDDECNRRDVVGEPNGREEIRYCVDGGQEVEERGDSENYRRFGDTPVFPAEPGPDEVNEVSDVRLA